MTAHSVPLATSLHVSEFPALKQVVSSDVIDFVYVDMDGVVADFEREMRAKGYEEGAHFKRLPGAYLTLPLYPAADEAVAILRNAFPKRVWFLSKPPSNSPYAWAEKCFWIRENFGDEGLHNLIITMDKSHVGTEKSVLFDDRPHKGGVSRFRGSVHHFGQIGPEHQPAHWRCALRWLDGVTTVRQFKQAKAE